MTRWIAILALWAGTAACQDTTQATAPVALTTEQCADTRYHSDLQEAGCVYEARELATLEGLDHAPVWVFYGYLHRHDEGFRLHVEDDPSTEFVALDLTKLPESELRFGLEPLVSWRTRIIGYYTSADVSRPAVSGAKGTLQMLSIGFIGDPARPRGAYDNAARAAAEVKTEAAGELGAELLRERDDTTDRSESSALLDQRTSANTSGLQVTSVSAAAPDPSSSDAGRFPGDCDRWSLTAAQAETFFALSTELDASVYHHEYETSRCMIAGDLVEDERQWEYQINGAAKGYWSDGNDMRYFGCTDAACDQLVLVPHIGMAP